MISKIAQRNGIQTVKVKLIEELNEAIEAVESNDEIDIIEELADVHILTQQYITLKMNRVEFDEVVAYKLERTMDRLGLSNNELKNRKGE